MISMYASVKMHNDEHKLMGVIFPLPELSIRIMGINVYASVKMHKMSIN